MWHLGFWLFWVLGLRSNLRRLYCYNFTIRWYGSLGSFYLFFLWNRSLRMEYRLSLYLLSLSYETWSQYLFLMFSQSSNTSYKSEIWIFIRQYPQFSVKISMHIWMEGEAELLFPEGSIAAIHPLFLDSWKCFNLTFIYLSGLIISIGNLRLLKHASVEDK